MSGPFEEDTFFYKFFQRRLNFGRRVRRGSKLGKRAKSHFTAEYQLA